MVSDRDTLDAIRELATRWAQGVVQESAEAYHRQIADGYAVLAILDGTTEVSDGE